MEKVKNVTPKFIRELKDNEIFVFGSNIEGKHLGGAAKLATNKFGAEWGVGDGLTGRCYAIPTMYKTVDEIVPFTAKFIEFAKANQDMTFLVTKIGCGIAGWSISEIAPLFKECINMDNVILPQEFLDFCIL